jgi:regulatory protein
VRDLGLSAGDEIDPAAVDDAARELERPEARERALRLLGYRERSASELVDRLSEDGYPADIVEDTVAELVRTGLVDDERFAAVLARTLVTVRGYGRIRARRELARYGIAEDVAAAALEEAAPASDERERADAAARRMARPSDTADRLAARLVRRGFSPGIALDVARHHAPRVFESDDTRF